MFKFGNSYNLTYGFTLLYNHFLFSFLQMCSLFALICIEIILIIVYYSLHYFVFCSSFKADRVLRIASLLYVCMLK